MGELRCTSCFILYSFISLSLHGYVLDGVCCKYTRMRTYPDTQTHLGSTHLYFQFDYPWGSFLVSLPPSHTVLDDVWWNDEVDDVKMHRSVSLYHHTKWKLPQNRFLCIQNLNCICINLTFVTFLHAVCARSMVTNFYFRLKFDLNHTIHFHVNILTS